MSERRRSALLGMFFGYAGLLVSLARNVLLVPIYLQRIPLAEYGAWLTTGGALALMLINDYGLSGVVTQRMSASYGARDFAALGRLTGTALAIGAVLSLALGTVGALLVPLIPGIGGLGASAQHTVMVCFAVAVAANAVNVLGASAAGIIRSLQRVGLYGAINLTAEVANVVVILVGLFLGHGLYALAAGLLARAAIIAAASLASVWILCARSLKTRIEIRPAAVRDLLGESSRFFLSSIAMRMQSQANVLFVGLIIGPASAAIYSLTVRAHETVLMLVNLVNGSLVPSVTHLFGSGNQARFRAVILRVLELVGALTALAMTTTVVLNPAFLRLWVGKDAFAGQDVSILMAVALFGSSIGGVAYDALIAQGEFRRVTRYYVIACILQAALLAVLLRLGLWAAPFVTALTVAVWGTGFWRAVSSSMELTLREAQGLLVELLRIVVVSVVLAAAFTVFYPMPQSWTALTIEALLCALCLAAAYFSLSPRLRRVAAEEIGSSWKVFRAG